jgi:hypothetical protein
MSLNLGTQQLLSDGTKWFSYSGMVVGDITVPASITLITVENTGLRDSYVCFKFFVGQRASGAGGTNLGQVVLIDDIEVFKSQNQFGSDAPVSSGNTEIFIPRQSKLQVLSLNTGGNNLQERGVCVIGYYI